MNLCLAAVVSLACAGCGAALGWWFSRLRAPYWAIGYFIPLGLIMVYALAFRFPGIVFVAPFSWLLLGIRKFAVFGFITAWILTTLLPRIPQKRVRFLVSVLMAVMVFGMAVLPFMAPMLDRRQLSGLETKMDPNGICLQTTDYTCGPAAAVTALRKLGLPAEEGQVAIWSCTSFQEGTTPDMLADALNRRYAAQGLSANCRTFKNIDELKQAGLTLAVIKYGFLVDHWVTVLEVTESEVVVGDPLGGLSRLSYRDFAKKWRFIGIALERKSPPAANAVGAGA